MPVHDSTHQTEERPHGEPAVQKTDSADTHAVIAEFDLYCLDCGRVIQEQVRREETTAPHAWSVSSSRPATCTEPGTETRVCGACGMEQTEDVPLLSHQYADEGVLAGKDAGPVEQDGKTVGSVTAAPTCTETGKGVLLCTLCGQGGKAVELPALGHAWGDWEELAVPAEACVTDRLEGRACTRCGEKETRVKEAAPGHDWGEWKEIDVPADQICVTDRTEERVCARCEVKETRVKETAPGHDWGEWEAIPVPEELICIKDQTEERVCVRCGAKETRVREAAPGHTWEVIQSTATCTEAGQAVRECTVCHLQESQSMPALGHTFAPGSMLIKQPAGSVRGTGSYEGKVIGTVETPSTCTEKGSGSLLCLNCGNAERVVEIPAGGHAWTEWEQAEIPEDQACVTDVTKTRHCPDCGEEETETVTPAPGHQWAPVSYSAPTCTEGGRAVRQCSVCKAEEVIETPAEGHRYMWVDRRDGKASDYVCSLCGDIQETRTLEETQMMYNNTITSYGPMTRELIGGSVWNRVTPLDISEEGTYTYPLIGSNCYTVGTATVVIENGTQRVTYKLNSNTITVHSESLVLYPDLESLRTGEKAVAVAFDDPVPIQDYFGNDQRVIMAITLKADYDAKGAWIRGFREDPQLLKTMRALIDEE